MFVMFVYIFIFIFVVVVVVFVVSYYRRRIFLLFYYF